MKFKVWIAVILSVIVVAAGCVGDAIQNTKRIATSPFRRSSAEGDIIKPYSYDFVMDIKVGGGRRATGHTIREPYNYQGANCVRTRTNQTTKLVREGATFETVKRQEIVTGPNGEAILYQEIKLSNGKRDTTTIRVENGKARFETTKNGITKENVIDVPENVLFSLDSNYISRQGLEIGNVISAPVIRTSKEKVVTETGTIVSNENGTFQGSPETIWKVKTESSDDSYVFYMYMTSDGRLVKMDADVATYVVVDEQAPVAEKPAEEVKPYEIVTRVPTDFEVPAWDNFDRIVFAPKPADVWAQCLRGSEYVKVTRSEEGELLVESRSVAPALPEKMPFPISRFSIPRELAGFIKPSGNICPDDPEIKKLAVKITGEEKDALNAVAYLAGWVNEKIKWNTKGRLNSSPRDTLQTLHGDCTEHADLFASLARSVNIPTRHCFGLMLQENEAVYHNWVEAWISGVWIPVDTTSNRVLLPAGYILTCRDENGDNDLADKLPLAMSANKDKMVLGIKSLNKGDYTVHPENKRSRVALNPEERWLGNLLWGFAMRLPEGWNGNAKLKYFTATSPDGVGVFKCEAIKEEYQVSRDELESLEAPLRQAMQGFKKHQSGFVKVSGRVSLFLDYSCNIDGQKMRCRQFIVPRRGRSYRLTAWAPASDYGKYSKDFMNILAGVEIE